MHLLRITIIFFLVLNGWMDKLSNEYTILFDN